MRSDAWNLSRRWRRVLNAAIAAIGVGTIVGSGGGFPDFHFDFSGPIAPVASIEPARTTVQVGSTVQFVANAFGTPPISYQWLRNGVGIAGATGDSYSLVGANLADDGAEFSVRVSNSVGAYVASSLLQVSSLPAVVYRDSDFVVSDWSVTATAEPLQNGPTHAESQAATGGNPGAFRSITFQMPAGPSSIHVFHTSLSSSYDPTVQGAIYGIDFALACNRLSTSTISETSALPMFEQDGRWFAPLYLAGACVSTWWTVRGSSLRADEFTVVAGPACAANQACPDFSASATPLRFGFVSQVSLWAGDAAGVVDMGVDNWQVSVWRR